MSEVGAAPLCLPPRTLRNPQALRLPKGTCDTHFHVFADGAPLVNPRSYTPQLLTLDGWRELADSFGISRGVLVQPSVYGTDNQVLLNALAAMPDRLRGVVVVHADTSIHQIKQLDLLGVRGVRINLRNKGGIGLAALEELAPRILAQDWHVQFQIGPDDIDTVADLCARYSITGVIDHLAFMPLDPATKPLQNLQRALDSGRVLTKISAPYRLADNANYDGYRAVIGELARSHADRLMWGSDWPHTEVFDNVPEEDDLVALSLGAVPVQNHDLVFSQTPRTLYWSN